MNESSRTNRPGPQDPTILMQAINWQRQEWSIELPEYAARVDWDALELEAVLHGALVEDIETQCHLIRGLTCMKSEMGAA